MKRRSILLAAVVMCSVFFADAQTRTLRIEYDATNSVGKDAMENFVVGPLIGASGVYLHAGAVIDLGNTDPFWANVPGPTGPIPDGEEQWGLDNGVGEMTLVPGETDLWFIELELPTFFYLTDFDSVPNIGVVFREEGPCGTFHGNPPCIEGKDDNGENIFIINLDATTAADPSVVNFIGEPFAGVTSRWVSDPVSIEDRALNVNSKVYPNPSAGSVFIDIISEERLEDFSIVIFDLMGKEVATVTEGTHEAGAKLYEWNASNGAGTIVPNGLYNYVVKSGEAAYSGRIQIMR